MLGSPAVYAQFVRRAAGATVKNLNIDIVRGVEVNLPSLGDQQRIAAILDQADSLRRLRQRAIDRLNSLGQAIFNEMFGEQAGNPKRWRTGELMDIVHDDDQINYGVVQPGVETESGVPLVRVADLLAPAIDIAALKKIDAEIESKYKRSRLRGDEVLVGCVGSIGAVTIAHRGMRGINIARAVGRIPVDPRKAHPQFIAEHLKTRSSQNYFRAETRTVAQPTLNIKQLKETPIMLPPLEKQEEFSHIASEVEKEKTSSSAYLESLNAFFSTLQHRAFRGEL
jgi:type I restriction enzyme S subunit